MNIRKALLIANDPWLYDIFSKYLRNKHNASGGRKHNSRTRLAKVHKIITSYISNSPRFKSLSRILSPRLVETVERWTAGKGTTFNLMIKENKGQSAQTPYNWEDFSHEEWRELEKAGYYEVTNTGPKPKLSEAKSKPKKEKSKQQVLREKLLDELNTKKIEEAFKPKINGSSSEGRYRHKNKNLRTFDLALLTFKERAKVVKFLEAFSEAGRDLFEEALEFDPRRV